LTDEGNIFNSNDAALLDGGGLLVNDAAASTMDQIKINSPMTFVGIIAVAACSILAVIFVTVFSVLQVSYNLHLDFDLCPFHLRQQGGDDGGRVNGA
jgi:hypothetical protein